MIMQTVMKTVTPRTLISKESTLLQIVKKCTELKKDKDYFAYTCKLIILLILFNRSCVLTVEGELQFHLKFKSLTIYRYPTFYSDKDL